jgi:hypothetical protein
VTLESALPYVSIGCAIGAGAAAAAGPSPNIQRTLKAIALLSLALFAFLRGVAPAALAMALVLSGLACVAAPRERTARVTLSAGLSVLAWLVLAWLCLRQGGGLQALAEPFRLAGVLLTLAAVAGLVVWARRGAQGAQLAPMVEAAVLGLLVLVSLTLRDRQWPAMAGAGGLLLAQAAGLARNARSWRWLGKAGEILPWVLSYVGQAAMAYVFLR